MSYIDKELKEFMSLLDSASATPGGGSASALISVISLSLARMVGHLTINKEAFLALPKEIQTEFNNSMASLLTLKEELTVLIDKDAESFNVVLKAYRLPKETKQEKEKRKVAIEQAMLGATLVPLETATKSLQAFSYLELILKHGNTSAITDVGVSVLALSAAIEGSLLNVLINLGGLSDTAQVIHYKNEVERIKKETATLKETYLAAVYEKLK